MTLPPQAPSEHPLSKLQTFYEALCLIQFNKKQYSHSPLYSKSSSRLPTRFCWGSWGIGINQKQHPLPLKNPNPKTETTFTRDLHRDVRKVIRKGDTQVHKLETPTSVATSQIQQTEIL